MSNGGSIELEGLDKCLKALEQCDRDVVEAALDGLEAGGQEIINDAIRNIRQDNIWTTGLLAQSGHVIRKEDDITAGFFDMTNKSGYAEFVEYGRRAGKMPPADSIAAWVYKKFHLQDWKQANSLGWAIARRIAAQGTQPHPFFGPAVKKNHNNIIKAVREAVRKQIK